MPGPARNSAARPVTFSNVGKLYFPSGFKKGEMLQYYLQVAPFMLPHLEQRPITLIRFPEGTKGESFYEKNAPAHTPEWVTTYQVPRHRHEGFINYILVNNTETLAWCANLGAIELHPFLHRAPRIDEPTHIAFDLDPGEGADLLTCIEVAQILKKLFAGLGLESYPKVSGSKGLQLYVPLNSGVTYAAAQPFAQGVAELLAQRHPDLIVSNMLKVLRKGKVLIDWSQNSQSKTTVAVYGMRAKRDEPFISMPVTWRELATAQAKNDVARLNFPPAEALARVKKLGDLFAPVLTLRQRLPDAFLQMASSESSRGSLARYAAKRDFSQTSEPGPTPAEGRATRRRAPKAGAPRFVIQKHAARNLHYDFRLEMDGTLKSWAVPKGPPYELGVKRAAFEVEDHPLDYMTFEGTIPKGQYGGGTVMVWDIGTYELLGGNHAKGDLKLWLHGKKLKGEWHIFRIKNDADKPMWLLAKSKVPAKPISAKRDDQSILTRRSMARIAADNDAQWQSNRGVSEDREEPKARSGRRTRTEPPKRRSTRRSTRHSAR